MKDSILEDIYYTLIGEMAPEYRVPGVEDAFAEGGTCDALWLELDAARNRILERLGMPEGDADLDSVTDCFMSIQKELCLGMFRLGWTMSTVSAEMNRNI